MLAAESPGKIHFPHTQMRVIDIVDSKIENVDKILQINCTATAFYSSESFPTFLYYNPYDTLKEVCFYQTYKSKTDLYDALNDEYLVRDAGEDSCFGIRGKSSRGIAFWQ